GERPFTVRQGTFTDRSMRQDGGRREVAVAGGRWRQPAGGSGGRRAVAAADGRQSARGGADELVDPLGDELGGRARAHLVEDMGDLARLEVELEGARPAARGERDVTGRGVDRAGGPDRDEEVAAA